MSDDLKKIWEKVDASMGPQRMETEAEHIARDMREGNFPKRSDPIQVPVDLPLAMTHLTDEAVKALLDELAADILDHGFDEDGQLMRHHGKLARVLLASSAELAATQTQVGDWIVRADEANVKVEKLEAELARVRADAAAAQALVEAAEARGMEQIASELHQMAMMVPDYESSKILENRASALRTIAAPTRAAEETGT